MIRWTLENPQLSRRLDVGPDIDIEQWRLSVPAKGACYLLTDAEDRPVLLSITGNLREALVHRLSPPEGSQPTRKTDYRAVTRHVHWRPVFSRFEANWTYLENARQQFPDTYAKMIRHWRAHWITINPHDEFPRFTCGRGDGEGEACGPIDTTKAARQVIETLEDMFDLCRYHEILVQAPHGKACAYKQMGKCPAPCDGTVSMEHYHGQLAEAMQLLRDPRKWIEQATQQMQKAAKELQFESAAKLKAKIEQITALTGPRMRWLRPIERMRLLALHKGRRKGCVRPFVVLPGRIVFLGEMQKRNRAELAWLAEQARQWMDAPPPSRLTSSTSEGIDRIALVSWHLLRGERDSGVYMELESAADAQRLSESVEASIR